MRVGFDVTALRTPRSGVGTYAANLLQHLEFDPQDEIIPMAPARTRPRINNTLWLQTVLPWRLSRTGVDVCHFTNSVASAWTPCPSVVTIHDTTLWRLPHYHPTRRLLAMRPFIPLGAKRARAIIAVSNSTKRDLVQTLNLAPDKVHVVYEAPATHFRPASHTAGLESLGKHYGLPDSFILYVGTLEPRKNLIRLLRAYALLRRCGYQSHALVLAGNRGWHDAAVFRNIERLGLNGSVHILGYVSTEKLVTLYNLADVFAFPSLYEGFGLPVIEAMACGTPVVTSPNGSLAEIAGNAAVLVDPLDVDSITAGLRQVLSDSQRQAELRAAGLARAAQFNWQDTAARTRRVYQSVL